MQYTNIEIKAKASEEEQNKIIEILKQNNAKYLGTDVQTDTYFKVERGRLKLRRGDIENYLIYYEREDKKEAKDSFASCPRINPADTNNICIKEAKRSDVILFNNQGRISELEKIMKKTHEILIRVEKKRNIYFIENVKFHIDNVSGLGRFIEIEANSGKICINSSSGKSQIKAISQNKLIPIEKLQEQCNYYKTLLEIKDENLIGNSYSDMLMENKNDNLDRKI